MAVVSIALPLRDGSKEEYVLRILKKDLSYEKAICMFPDLCKVGFTSESTYYKKKKAWKEDGVDATTFLVGAGGKRANAGAKRKPNSVERRVVSEHKRYQKKKQEGLEDGAHETNWLQYTFPPLVCDITECCKMAGLSSVKKDFLRFGLKTFRCPPDSTLIADLNQDGDERKQQATGQRRKILVPTSSQEKKEFFTKKSDGLFVREEELGPDLVIKLTKLRVIIQEKLSLEHEEMFKLPAVSHLIEMELMMTPTSSVPQSPHQDSLQNICTAFVELNNPGNSSCSTGTFFAEEFREKGTILSGKSLSTLKYKQLTEAGQATKRIGPHIDVVFNHATWPHHGPGNQGSCDRYVLFFTFAMDTIAKRHTTGEVVLHSFS